MKKTPYISIIMAGYNGEKFLPRALEAIARQSFRDFELIFSDDASKDGTVSLVEAFRQEHPEIPVTILVHEKNLGVATTANDAIAAANGKYICINDQDDWMDDNCLELLAAAAKETDADRVVGAYREVNEEGKLLRVRMNGKHLNPWVCNMMHANLLKLRVIRENHIESKCWLGDAERAMFFSLYGPKTVYIDTPSFNYLIHQGTDTKGVDTHKKIWIEERSLTRLLSRFREVYDKITLEEDRKWAEYEAVRMYYIYIYLNLIYAPLKEKKSEYRKLREIMQEYYPGYLKNQKISLFRTEGDDFNSRRSVWISAMAERLHMMNILLTVFHVASKSTSMYV